MAHCARGARGTTGPWGPCAVGPWTSPEAIIVGRPSLKTGPGGYHCGETILGGRKEKDAQRHGEQNKAKVPR